VFIRHDIIKEIFLRAIALTLDISVSRISRTY
jgi:hypothetical protein